MRRLIPRPLHRAVPLLLAACAFLHDAPAAGTASVSVTVSSEDALAKTAPAASPTPVNETGMQKPKEHNAGYSSVNVAGPCIAMTFDDGPHGTFTPRLLDMLAKRNIKATFFIVGQCAQEFPDIMKRIAAEGHEIANHSWSHPAFSKMSDAAVRSQIERTQQIAQQTAGVTPSLLRPPYGAITTRQKQWINDTFKLGIILWSVDPLDWRKPGPAVVTRRIVSETRPGAIILAHDIHEQTVTAMDDTLDQLLAKGFKFVTVSQLLAMEVPPAPKPTPAAETTPAATPVKKTAARKKRSGQ